MAIFEMLMSSIRHLLRGNLLCITRKYLLRGYILGVLTHTTAWDRLWGDDVFLGLYIGSSALPRMAAV